jgi:transcriptional regulator with XRE-family HTH domain
VETTERKTTRGKLLKGLKRAREEAPLSQRELARLSGTSQITIHRLESQEYGAYPATTRKLSKALGVPPRVLMEGPEEVDDG